MTTPPPPPPPKPEDTRRTWILRGVSLLAVAAFSFYIYTIRDQFEWPVLYQALQTYGYPAIFVITVVSNASLILPIPSMALVFASTGTLGLNPLIVGILAGVGATLGELSGYMVGYGGQAVVENRALYEKLETWMKKYGPITLVVLAFIPNPVFDLAGVAAGALKMPIHEFLFWCLLGKIPKMVLTAYAGALSLDWVLRLFGRPF